MRFKVRMRGTDECRIIPCQPAMLNDLTELEAMVRERFAADGPFCLFVVKKDGATISEDDIAAYCRDNFTAYKRPKVIEFRDELPKSNVGKILRRELRSGH